MRLRISAGSFRNGKMPSASKFGSGFAFRWERLVVASFPDSFSSKGVAGARFDSAVPDALFELMGPGTNVDMVYPIAVLAGALEVELTDAVLVALAVFAAALACDRVCILLGFVVVI